MSPAVELRDSARFHGELVLAAGLLPAGSDALIDEVAETGCERYPGKGRPWPSGVHGGLNPSLFLGAAGPGRFLLRLALPERPSVLAPARSL